jgi:hypothetical protein
LRWPCAAEAGFRTMTGGAVSPNIMCSIRKYRSRVIFVAQYNHPSIQDKLLSLADALHS